MRSFLTVFLYIGGLAACAPQDAGNCIADSYGVHCAARR
jgi:hypothetical protein